MAIRKQNGTAVVQQPAPSRGAVATRPSSEMSDFGSISTSDVIMPRLKLLQGMSPEVKTDPRQFIQGEFFHSGMGECIGDVLNVVPVMKQDTTWDLWGDRDSNDGLLAQADENGRWLPGYENREFVINRRKVYTRENMYKSGLNAFGSSDPNNPRSKPMLAETYRVIFWLLDYNEASPVMFIASRMLGLRVKELLTRMTYRGGAGVPYYKQIFEMRSNLDRYKSNEYFTPHFTPNGELNDEELADRIKATNNALQGRKVKVEDEGGDEGRGGPRGPVDASDRASY
jgi:hypothetical protein